SAVYADDHSLISPGASSLPDPIPSGPTSSEPRAHSEAKIAPRVFVDVRVDVIRIRCSRKKQRMRERSVVILVEDVLREERQAIAIIARSHPDAEVDERIGFLP